MKNFPQTVKHLAICVLLYVFAGCHHNPASQTGAPAPSPTSTIPDTISPTIIAIYPHDSTAFTQGLFYHQGSLYESTGRYGQSSLRKVELSTGTVQELVPLPGRYFGEGLAVKGDRLVQLTWLEQTAFVFSFPDLIPVDSLHYTGQGWGLTSDSVSYIMSDGSSRLFFRDDQFNITRTLEVTVQGTPLSALNELEYVEGVIYANVWKDSCIYVINPRNGAVETVIRGAELIAIANPRDASAVLNGIAYNPSRHTFYLTGKLWRFLFEVKLE